MIELRSGTVRELHALDPFVADLGSRPAVWWYAPQDAAVVLGSRQSPDILDGPRCAALGLDVVRRRSGGGAVLIVPEMMLPESMLWVDLIVPPGVAPDDVHGSMVWAGELWCAALDGSVSGALTVNRGTTRATAWSQLVCFAGIGPGEVLLDDRKLVGLSQRRTRHGLRIQCTLYTRQPPIDLASLFSVPTPDDAVPAIAFADPPAPRAIVERLAAALTGV